MAATLRAAVHVFVDCLADTWSWYDVACFEGLCPVSMAV
jgi:hypothetical protein